MNTLTVDMATSESMNAFSLCFQNFLLEEDYRRYQFELVRNSLVGKLGTLSTTSISALCTLIPNFIAYFMQFGREKSPGTGERMLYSIPVTMFAIYHQLNVQLWNGSKVGDRRSCDFFVVGLIILFAHQDFLNAHFVNDRFPEYEGCKASRFRCPYSFSSSLFGSRGIALTAVLMVSFPVQYSRSAVVWR